MLRRSFQFVSAGDASTSVRTAGLRRGRYRVSVRAQDATGNKSPVSSVRAQAVRVLLCVVLLALVPASVARADGDPASDVLLSQDAYFPYAPTVQKKLQTALEDVLKEAREAGYPMKVALINTEADLGAYPDLFNQPQKYSDLLKGELAALNPHGDPVKEIHLLIVMPGGFGGSNLGEGVDRALSKVSINADAQSDGLAVAAIGAVAPIWRPRTVTTSPSRPRRR